MPEQDGSTRIVVGTLAGMEARNGGWMRFSIAEAGKQYPVKGDTKKPEIIAQCQALLGQDVKVQVTEKDSGNPNPNRPGSNFINRYLEAVALAQGGDVSQEMQPQQGNSIVTQAPTTASNSAPASGASYTVPEHERTRQVRIMRQNALSHATALAVAEKIPSDEKSIIAFAERCMAYIIYGPTHFGVTAFGATAAPPAPEAPAPEAPPAEEVYTCSDCGTNDPNMHSTDCLPF